MGLCSFECQLDVSDLEDVVRVFDGHTTCCHRRPASALGARPKLALRACVLNAVMQACFYGASTAKQAVTLATFDRDHPGRHENFGTCDARRHMRLQSSRACQALPSRHRQNRTYHGTTTAVVFTYHEYDNDDDRTTIKTPTTTTTANAASAAALLLLLLLLPLPLITTHAAAAVCTTTYTGTWTTTARSLILATCKLSILPWLPLRQTHEARSHRHSQDREQLVLPLIGALLPCGCRRETCLGRLCQKSHQVHAVALPL